MCGLYIYIDLRWSSVCVAMKTLPELFDLIMSVADVLTVSANGRPADATCSAD